jgi:thiamine-monophosphate kinase
MTEFNIIEKYFNIKQNKRPDVVLGIGDDAAILECPPGQQLLLTTDTLVENTHFFSYTDPYTIGYRSLAVNLSDLAAMGATPAWALLSLVLSEFNDDWLTNFSAGFFNLLKQYQMNLIGGNLAKGPLSITVQVAGFVSKHQALVRHGAKVGDYIFVTGKIGEAHAELINHQSFLTITPRIKEGIALRTIAHSCIDISDGLLADLTHILEASHVGAHIQLEKIPVSAELSWEAAITGGEDYELCFTVPENKINLINFDCTCIGRIEAKSGLRIFNHEKLISIEKQGWQHFC